MSQPPSNLPPADDAMMLIDAYLAGELDAAAGAAVEQRAGADPAFRAELESQRALQQQLRAVFEPPAMGLSDVPGSTPAVVGRLGPRRWWIGVAAAAAVVALGVTGYLMTRSEDLSGVRTPDQVYATIVRRGFKPAIVCPNDPAEFARLVKGRLGVALTPMLAADSGIALTGWGYQSDWGTPLGPGTMMLLAKKGDAKIVVFIDRVKNDRTMPEPGGGKHLYRKTTGELVLYEISPLNEPIVLPALEAR